MGSYFIPNPRGNSTFTQSAQEMEGKKVPRLVRWLAGNALDTEPGDLNSSLGTHAVERIDSWKLAFGLYTQIKTKQNNKKKDLL